MSSMRTRKVSFAFRIVTSYFKVGYEKGGEWSPLTESRKGAKNPEKDFPFPKLNVGIYVPVMCE